MRSTPRLCTPDCELVTECLSLCVQTHTPDGELSLAYSGCPVRMRSCLLCKIDRKRITAPLLVRDFLEFHFLALTGSGPHIVPRPVVDAN